MTKTRREPGSVPQSVARMRLFNIVCLVCAVLVLSASALEPGGRIPTGACFGAPLFAAQLLIGLPVSLACTSRRSPGRAHRRSLVAISLAGVLAAAASLALAWARGGGC